MARRNLPGPAPRRVRAYSDCETCRPGAVSQPANTVSSLAYVVAGADLLGRKDPDKVFAWTLIGVGVGSVAYHGPGGVAGKWLHDATLLAMLGLLTAAEAAENVDRPLTPAAVTGVVGAAAVGAHPRTTDAAQIVAGATAAVAEARRFTQEAGWRSLFISLPLWTAGATFQMLGRTNERWCRPDSPLQAHAAWHVASAAALWNRRGFRSFR